MALQTGSGATIAFGTAGFTAKYTRIGGAELSREAIETTDLSVAPASGATTGAYKTFVPDVLIDGGSLRVNFIGTQIQLESPRLTFSRQSLSQSLIKAAQQ